MDATLITVLGSIGGATLGGVVTLLGVDFYRKRKAAHNGNGNSPIVAAIESLSQQLHSDLALYHQEIQHRLHDIEKGQEGVKADLAKLRTSDQVKEDVDNLRRDIQSLQFRVCPFSSNPGRQPVP